MNPYNFSLLFFAFCSFLISILIWLKREDEIGKMYFVFSTSVAIWGMGLSILISQSASYDTALYSARIANAAAVFIPVTWLHFTLTFSGRIKRYQGLLRFLYLSSIFIDLFAVTPWFIPEVKPAVGFNRYSRLGPIYHIFTFIFFTVVPLGFAPLIKKMRDSLGRERLQLKGFIIATSSGFLGGALTFLPAYEIMFPQYGLFLMPIYPFVMAYFMIRKRLFDLEEIAQAAQREKLAAIGTLATSINHEIRNPLYVIKGFAESHLENLKQGVYASDGEALAKSSEILSKSIEQTQRAMEIIKRFALFAKQGTREEAQFEEVDLSRTFEEILPLVSHELELDKIQLINEIQNNLPPIHADRRHIEEIFFNLIVNACQAMKNGGELTVHAEQRNGSIQVDIQDQGPGIPSDQLSKIFEPFYTTKESGTGLGLYITKQLVERNKGHISVESKPNKGTRFILRFPSGV